MKKFIKKLTLFVIPVLLILVSIEVLARLAPNSYRFKKNWMDKNSDKIEMLILGSSHTFCGINPEYMKVSCFNLANILQSLHYDDFLLRKYINRSPRLKYVILPISAFSLYGKLEDGGGWYRIINYQLYMGSNDYKGLSKYNFEISHFRYAVKKVSALLRKKDKIHCNSLGFCTNYSLDRKDTNWDDGSFVAKSYEADVSTWKNYKENVGYLEDISKLCQEKNIKLILVTTPARPSFYNNVNRTFENRNIATIEGIKAKYKNVSYLNFIKDNRFQPDDFFNADHLSDVGATKFTILLQDSILK